MGVRVSANANFWSNYSFIFQMTHWSFKYVHTLGIVFAFAECLRLLSGENEKTRVSWKYSVCFVSVEIVAFHGLPPWWLSLVCVCVCDV